MGSFEVQTRARCELLDVTEQVRRVVARSDASDGSCLVFVPHTTAAVTVNEAYDPDVARDFGDTLNRLVPTEGSYRHREGNADAHVKAILVGSSCHIPVVGGRLLLGRWQGVFFCEFDGPRRRSVEVRVISG